MSDTDDPASFQSVWFSRPSDLHPEEGHQGSHAPELTNPWHRCPNRTNRPRTTLLDERFDRIRCHSACRGPNKTDHNPNTPFRGVQAGEGIFWTQSAPSFFGHGREHDLRA